MFRKPRDSQPRGIRTLISLSLDTFSLLLYLFTHCDFQQHPVCVFIRVRLTLYKALPLCVKSNIDKQLIQDLRNTLALFYTRSHPIIYTTEELNIASTFKPVHLHHSMQELTNTTCECNVHTAFQLTFPETIV